MIITRIEVRNFRKLLGPVTIDNLGPGLSIIEGDNEEGKSTLLQAIRCGFFEKHTVGGERASSFQPYNSAVRPEITIDFEIEGQKYVIQKAFCQRPEATLTSPLGRFTGDAAEEELEKLLRFTRAKRPRRDEDHEHEGIFGLFWVEQGKSFAPLDPNDENRSSIVQALQKEVGDVLGGKRGRLILGEVSKRRNELATPTGKPRGEYAAANKIAQEIGADLATVNQVLSDQERSTEEVERYRGKLSRHQQEGVLESARERAVTAQKEHRKIEELERALRDAQVAVSAAKVKQELAVSRSEQRTQLLATVVTAERKVEEFKTDLEQKQGVLQQARERVQNDERAASEVTSAFESAEVDYRKAEAGERLARTNADLNRLIRDEKAALKAKEAQDVATVAANAIGIEKKHITQLKKLEEAVTRSQAQLDAIATNIRVKLSPGLKAKLDGLTIESGTEHKLTSLATLEISKSAQITIIPGGDISNPRAQAEQDLQRLRQVLNQLAVESIGDAESRLERRIEFSNTAEQNGQLVEAHAPDGVDGLRQRITTAQGEVKRLLETAKNSPSSIEDGDKLLRIAHLARQEAEEQVTSASRRAKLSREGLGTAIEQQARCQAGYDSEKAHFAEAEKQVVLARKEASDNALNEAVVRAAQEIKTAAVTADVAQAELDKADPETVARELRIAEQAVVEVERDIQSLREKVIRLETELRATGASGFGERKLELEGRLVAAQTAATQFEYQMKVIDLLHATLSDAEREAKETFLRPVTERVEPYLKLLLPGTELKLDEDMHIVGLKRGAVEEKFESLSIGTREQLAVLTRLAFAELLREHGQPSAVLLDDAIVYADDQRFDRMLHILHKAAEHLQVIVLTCRERDYLTAGAPIIRLAECG